MGRKIFSSREEPTRLDLLQDLVFIAHSALGNEDEPSENEIAVLTQLETAMLELAELTQYQSQQLTAQALDLFQLTMQNMSMIGDLRTALNLIEALARPVNDSDAFHAALKTMRRESDPEIMSQSTGDAGIEIDVALTFTENKLAEALKIAIEEYINLTAQAAAQ